jgi:hypothetical protein
MSRILTAALFVFTLSTPAFADTVPAGATVWQSKPTGAGKPDAISCYQVVPIGSHIRDLKCARNSEWARLYRGTNLDTVGANSPADSFGPSPRASELRGN